MHKEPLGGDDEKVLNDIADALPSLGVVATSSPDKQCFLRRD